MLQKFIAAQYETALLQLKNEINSYTHKDHVWQVKGQIANSGGTLALHLIGNLRHFIGTVLANTGYVRQRDKEFSDRDVPTGKIIKDIDEVTYMVRNTISNLTDAQLFGEFPLKDGKEDRMGNTTIQRLVYFLAHLNYHLGQINYHRRLFDQPVSLPDNVLQLEQPNTLAHH